MIKYINHQNFLTTPFVAKKVWDLNNINSDDLVVVEPPNVSPDVFIALEYVDSIPIPPELNRECNIALEQQDSDRARYQEGITGSGLFYPDLEARNADGTFKRLVHDQTELAFYNSFRNPLLIFGLDNIDFPLSRTDRFLSDFLRVFTIPQTAFGDKISAGSVQLNDTSLDDNIQVVDDTYGNLIASHNLFSKIQEVRHLGNLILTGSAAFDCPTIDFVAAPTNLTASFVGTASLFDLTRSLNLVWQDNSNNEDGFVVQKSTDGIAWVLFDTTMTNETGSSDTLFFGDSYLYRVYAIFGMISSSFSNVVSASFNGTIETFDEYTANQTTNFTGGLGNWGDHWLIDQITRMAASESFDEYATDQTGSLTGSVGWSTPWFLGPSFATLVVSESFDEYTTDQTGSFNSGSGWSNIWTII